MPDISRQVEYWRQSAEEDWAVAAELASLSLRAGDLDTLGEMNAFQMAGRYPIPLLPEPTLAEAQAYIARAEEVYRWLMNQC